MYDGSMHRTQILLETGQYETLRTLAARGGKSLSDLIREAVAQFLETESPSSTGLSSIQGIFEDTEISGLDHDRVLYGGSVRT